MNFRIADTFTDSLARLTGGEQKGDPSIAYPASSLLASLAAAEAPGERRVASHSHFFIRRGYRLP
jgi:hypothetical protein